MKQIIETLRRWWSADRLACGAGLMLTLGGIALLALPTYLPMQDMLAHIEVLSVLRRLLLGETLTHYALTSRIQPYIAMYVLAFPLSLLVGEDWAIRLLCMGYVVAMPLSAAYMLRAYGRDIRLALFASALTFNTCFLFGFLPNCFSYPILFLLLGSFRYALLEPTPRREVANAALLMLLYVTHLSGAIAFAVAGPITLLVHTRGDVSQLLRRSLFVVPAVTVAMWWQVTTIAEPISIYKMTWLEATRGAATWLARATFSRWDFLYVAVILGTWLALWALAYRQRARGVRTRASWGLGAVGAGLTWLYFMMPFEISAPIVQVAVNMRLLVPAAVCLVGAPAARLTGRAAWVLAPLFLANVIWLGALGVQSARLQPSLRQIEPIIAALPADACVLMASQGYMHAGTFWLPHWHMVRLHTLRGDGVITDGFANRGPQGVMPVRYTQSWPEADGHEWSKLTYAEHARWYDYVLLISEETLQIEGSHKDIDKFEIVRREGVFTLLRVLSSQRGEAAR